MVLVKFPSGAILDTPATKISDIIKGSELDGSLAVKLNNELVGLETLVDSTTAELQGIRIHDKLGVFVYKKSLVFLLGAASQRAFPEKVLSVQNAIGSAYYAEFVDFLPSQEQVAILEWEMKKLVQEELPIVKTKLPFSEASQYFESHKKPCTAALLRSRTDPYVEVYKCGDFFDLSRFPLVANTAALGLFKLEKHRSGFVISYPTTSGELAPFKDEPLIATAYATRKAWQKAVGFSSLADINNTIISGKYRELIQISEALHDKQFIEIANRIEERQDKIKLILIAGPSSSGKTTFAHRLSIHLKAVGLRPVTISVDDYYNGPDRVPRDAKGNRDYERIEALNTELLNKNLVELFDGKESLLPKYDFKAQMPFPESTWKTMKLPPGGIIIIEGIHCLNDQMTERIPRDHKFKIAITPLSSVSIDDHSQIGNVSVRLVRRMVRDYLTRGHSALKTLQMWPAVTHGEVHYIFPHQNSGEVVFNSGILYEMNVLKVFVEPLLKSIPVDVPEYGQARQILHYLEDFIPMPGKLVPPQSLLLEFINGSWYYDTMLVL
mmetsp:Transcript_22972/g.39424  ORF Transcript_22972/g.39424 Transcript_22972/m.39424 type:complete len:552 (+) Transcript_22972:74-1729(+)|eukprot:CAMPEP_0196657200 /NCGR_PEP_ID=MMETSP1086-20130531/22500_1 /TAXON_ID=77921 /ORGANISM="Cyanoptyche  gloeocystis , Strain SAG4.97" /LENGTH=551 /DNA_ID=CAMNT_0041990243 /DNA_START=66 /DNA_END=1721 /DNA_ORIENTATION=-